MTIEELTIVQKLNRQLIKEEQKLHGFKNLLTAAHQQFARVTYPENKKSKSYTYFDTQPKSTKIDSRVECLAVLIVDTEKVIEELKARLAKETPALVLKIQKEFQEPVAQSILIYRYVFLKKFRDIGFLMQYSEQRIYQKHREILKRL